MPKDTKTLGNNKARAWESLGFAHKKRLCQHFDTTSFFVLQFFPAERQGFEPRVPRSTTVFKTAAIDHSATSPKLLYQKCFPLKAVQRYESFLNLQTI